MRIGWHWTWAILFISHINTNWRIVCWFEKAKAGWFIEKDEIWDCFTEINGQCSRVTNIRARGYKSRFRKWAIFVEHRDETAENIVWEEIIQYRIRESQFRRIWKDQKNGMLNFIFLKNYSSHFKTKILLGWDDLWILKLWRNLWMSNSPSRIFIMCWNQIE